MSCNRQMIDPIHDCKLLGVIRALTGLRDSVVVVHGRPGCHSGMLSLQALTSSQRFVNVVFSGLKSEDMAFGGEARLFRALLNVSEVMKPKLVVVAIASAAGIMGDDVAGVVKKVLNSVKDVLFTIIDACGYSGSEAAGYEEMLEKLGSFMVQTRDKVENSVNIIGFRADEPHWRGDLHELKRLLSSQGISINTIITSCGFDELIKAPKASLNVVLGGDGMGLAEYMKREFDVPYVVTPYPFGILNTVEFLEKICKALGKDVNYEVIEAEERKIQEAISDEHLFLEGVYGSLRVALLGESSRVFSFAKFLSDELAFDVKLIAVRCKNFITNDEISKVSCKVLVEPDRLDFEDEVLRLGVDMLFASSFERNIAMKLRIPLFRLSYPVIDEVYLTDAPLAGFRGSLTILEKLVNLLMKRQEISEFAYLISHS